MNFLNYDLDRPFVLRSVSIGPKCSGTFYHTYFLFRLYTVKRIPEVEEFRMCETKVGLRNILYFFLPTESISSDLIFRVRASDYSSWV